MTGLNHPIIRIVVFLRGITDLLVPEAAFASWINILPDMMFPGMFQFCLYALELPASSTIIFAASGK